MGKQKPKKSKNDNSERKSKSHHKEELKDRTLFENEEEKQEEIKGKEKRELNSKET